LKKGQWFKGPRDERLITTRGLIRGEKCRIVRGVSKTGGPPTPKKKIHLRGGRKGRGVRHRKVSKPEQEELGIKKEEDAYFKL